MGSARHGRLPHVAGGSTLAFCTDVQPVRGLRCNGRVRRGAARSWRAVGAANQPCRDRWVTAALAALPEGDRILDAGAGEQRYRVACEHLRYVSQDFAQYVPAAAPAGLREEGWEYGSLDIVSDITAIPEPDASFDAVLCTEVLEHVPDPPAAIAELARLLRPGGTLILTAPFASLTHQAPYHFATGFSRFYYEHHLEKAGFKITEISPNGSYFEYVAQEVRRLRSMAPVYTHRRLRIVERLGVVLTLRALARLNRLDEGSAELAVFGYHVQAVRRS